MRTRRPSSCAKSTRWQARVYADVLHKQGYGHVTLKFVRVEQPDPTDPTQPQVVTYNLSTAPQFRDSP